MAVMDREDLLRSLKGQRMHMPCFDTIFQNWPISFNPRLQGLKCDVDDRLATIVEYQYQRKSEQARALKRLQAPNYALRGAYWWPGVDDRTLHTMTFLTMWISLWDDIFDSNTQFFKIKTLAHDFEAAQEYRYQTLLYIRQCLKLPTSSYQCRPHDILITSFEDVAEHVNAVCSVEQRERFYREIKAHVLATSARQVKKSLPEVPTLDTYLKIRMEASGVELCLTLLEICEQVQLPPEIRTDPNLKKLLDQVNIIVLVTNDILSLKCKIARGNVDNLIALLSLSNPTLDSAVSVALSILDAAKRDFDETARVLVAEHVEDGLPNVQLESLVKTYKATCAGNLIWSMSTMRCDVHECECERGLRHTLVL